MPESVPTQPVYSQQEMYALYTASHPGHTLTATGVSLWCAPLGYQRYFQTIKGQRIVFYLKTDKKQYSKYVNKK